MFVEEKDRADGCVSDCGILPWKIRMDSKALLEEFGMLVVQVIEEMLAIVVDGIVTFGTLVGDRASFLSD